MKSVSVSSKERRDIGFMVLHKYVAVGQCRRRGIISRLNELVYLSSVPVPEAIPETHVYLQ